MKKDKLPAPSPVQNSLPGLLGQTLGSFLSGSAYMRKALEKAEEIEGRLLSHLQQRLDHLQARDYQQRLTATGQEPGQLIEHPGALVNRMNVLRELAIEQNAPVARDALFNAILDQLTPDEVRMLTALSDGSGCPYSHLEAVSRIGSRRFRVMGYISRASVEYGLTLSEYAPFYLRRLVALGLLDEREDLRDSKNTYEIFENSSAVRHACDEISQHHKMSPRFIRGSLMLSTLGRDFWEAST
ncbi:MAG: DUF4393 domain-containing protein [Marinobacter sp.]|nr:DUF4393 domain-containing protein [Marinobacter sp.]